VLPLASHLVVRRADTAAHQEALATARQALRNSPVYPSVREEVGSEHVDAVTLLLFAVADRLTTSQRDWLGPLNGPICEEVTHLRAQVAALLDIRPWGTTGSDDQGRSLAAER